MAGSRSQFSFSLYNGERVQVSLESMRQSTCKANESKLECNLRRANDRQSKSRKRASETEQETVKCRASDRQCKAKRRANETEQGTSDVRKRSHATCNLQILIIMPLYTCARPKAQIFVCSACGRL